MQISGILPEDAPDPRVELESRVGELPFRVLGLVPQPAVQDLGGIGITDAWDAEGRESISSAAVGSTDDTLASQPRSNGRSNAMPSSDRNRFCRMWFTWSTRDRLSESRSALARRHVVRTASHSIGWRSCSAISTIHAGRGHGGTVSRLARVSS
ncbi:MAG: hypothetical protein J0I66_03605, partial [Microbacterium sp.]|nr:hypothetical protein [Microbacterium sp.]